MLETALETEMPPFPRTYGVVRGGSAETVTVGDVEALLALRTELELVLQLGAVATPEMIAALDARLGELVSQESGQTTARRDDVADMRSIVTDAQAPANSLVVDCIDADFPDIKGVLNMSAIEKESEQFQQEVAEVIADAPASGADASEADGLAEAFTGATSEETPRADTPQAGGSEPNVEAGDTVFSEEEVETVAEALEELAAEAENELDAIASGFEKVANELTDLADTGQATVGKAESPDDESQDVADGAATDGPDVAEPAATDVDDVDALLESIEADVSATPASDDETVDDAFEALAQASEAAAAGATDQETFDPFAADETATTDEPAQTVGVVDSTATITEPVTPNFSGSTPASQGNGSFRGQLGEIKQNLIFQIDRLAEVLDEVADMQERARKTASQAAQFKQAADRAQAASQQFTAAQAEADQARSAYEQAEARVADARRVWETTQRTATEAAQHVEAGM